MKTKGFVLFVAFCVVSSVSSTAEGVLVAGDVNVSGEVNALDVQVVINAALGLSVEHDCDIDISSEVDAVDVQLVINAALGLSIDADDDGLCDVAEANLGTDPDVADTDGDGVGDGQEVRDGTDPLTPTAEPTVELTADPPLGDAPHEVVLTAEATGFTGNALTYTWDFGDGIEYAGQASVWRMFESEDEYEVTVTVSDGVSQAADEVTVTVETLPQVSEAIGSEGGAVTLADISVAVPADYLPESVQFTLTEIPSLTVPAAESLDVSQFQLFGAAYRFDTPLRSTEPLTVTFSYDPADIPAGFTAEHVGVVTRAVGLGEALADAPREMPLMEARYAPEPVTPGSEPNTVQFETFHGGTYQLVAMAAPLDVTTFAEVPKTSGKAKTVPSVRIVHLDPWDVDPQGTSMDQLLQEGFSRTYQAYAGLGFRLPPDEFTFVIQRVKPTLWGWVPVSDYGRVHLNARTPSQEQLWKTIAHECFHVIQFYNSNPQSTLTYWDEIIWLLEGSAEWGSDQVFDTITDMYTAATAARFEKQLDGPPSVSSGYDTAVFWKWLEEKTPGTLKSMVDRQRAVTTQEPEELAGGLIVLPNEESYEDALRAVRTDIPFMSFFCSALFHKDFDTNETNTGELWHADKLGPPNQLPTGLPKPGNTLTLKKGERGDSKDNRAYMSFNVAQQLTADVLVFKNTLGEHALEGQLHVEFDSYATAAALQATVIAHQGTTVVGEEMIASSGQSSNIVKVPFDAETEATVIAVNPHWDTGPSVGSCGCEVWVSDEDPCGDLPQPIVDVDTTEEFEAALLAPPEGGTIRLAPGFYYPSARTWETDGEPQVPTFDAYVMLDDVTLAGSGSGDDGTIIQMNSGLVRTGIFVRGDAVIRDIKLTGFQASVYVSNAGEFEMCNVVLRTYEYYGVVFEVWGNVNTTYTVRNSEISHSDADGGYAGGDAYDGIQISAYCLVNGSPPSLRLILEDNLIRYWDNGVWYSAQEDDCRGSVTVETDCEGFVGCTYNVQECYSYVSGRDPIEHCP